MRTWTGKIKSIKVSMMKCLTVFFLMAAAAGVMALELVKEGKPTAEIVIDKDAYQGIKLAAEDLRKYLREISGAELKTVNQPTPGVANQVYVGESNFTRKLGYKLPEFKNSGYDILVKENYAVLAGPVVYSEDFPYKMSRNDSLYLSYGLKDKPADFPSPGLKAWQDFCGEKFTTLHVGNGGGNFNAPLKIFTNDDIGAWHAVTALLEQLGVRFYAPYEDGTVIPQKKTISVPDQRVTVEAKFARREFCYYNSMRADEGGIAWLKRLKGGNNNLIVYNHTTYAIYGSREQHELHPEYLAEESPGKRWSGYPAGWGVPRYTNPDFKRAGGVFLRKMFDAFPNLSGVAVGPPDGTFTMDYRDLAAYRKDGMSFEQAASDYVWDFNIDLARELKKTHPDKFLLYMSKSNISLLPSNLDKSKVPDNILFPSAQPYSAHRVVDSVNKAYLDKRKPWIELQEGRKAPIWDYFLYYRRPNYPRYPVFFTGYLQREMREMLPYADGKFIELQPASQSSGAKNEAGQRIGMVPMIHLMMYVQMKLFWDPELDMNKLLDEYYQLYFGPAAAEMKEFHEFAEEVWCRQESRSVTPTTGFLKEKDVDRYFAILERALAKAPEGSVYRRRITALVNDMSSLKTLFPNLQRTGPDIRAYKAPEPWRLDGNVDKYKHGWNTMVVHRTGESVKRDQTRAAFAMTADGKYLLAAFVCYENNMDKLKTACIRNDDATIFNDDVVELYLNSPERSYFKIVVNPNGAIYDETQDVTIIERDTLPILWNPGCKAVVKKYDDRWTVELMIPVKDLGQQAPTKQLPWGIQAGRTRFAGKETTAYSIAPANGPYATLNHWGNLWMR